MNAWSQSLGRLADEAWALRLREPYFRLRTGRLIETLPRGTLREAEQEAAEWADLGRRLAAVEISRLTADERLTHGFLAFLSREGAATALDWESRFPVTPYNSGGLTITLAHIFAPFRFEAKADADRFLGLINDYEAQLAAIGARLRAQAKAGWTIPRPALPGVRAGLQRLAAYAPVALRAALGRDGAPDGLAAKVERALDERVAPSLAAMLEAVDGEYERRAPETVGLAQYPGGEAAYHRCIRGQLTVEEDPYALHALGVDEVARITGEMLELRLHNGWARDEAEFHSELRASASSYAHSPQEVEALYRGHIERMRAKIPAWFSIQPKAPFDVARLAPELEAGMTYGYYEAPMGAGTCGYYRYNGSGLENRSQLNAAALIFHELVPGHHFHLARQAESETLPEIRRHAVEITVFNEGWAEYASSLGREMGLYDNPLDLYGRLLHERFIAQRLVVDTGLNAFGWGLERARVYMRAQTIESDAQIATETLRYATDLPGQALAYHYGFRRFRELRFRAEQAMGEGFDLRALHETILSAGALPLEVLDRHVDHAYARTPTDKAIEVTRGERRIHVEVEGDPGSTPVILAIHGGPGFSLDYFRPGLSRLRDQGYAIAYLDLPGGGRSSRHPPGESRLEPYLADIEAVCFAIGASRLTLLGHAFGAVLAVEYALSHPVDRLILVNPLRVFRSDGQDAEAQARRVEATDPGLYPDYFDRLAPKIERARAGETALWSEIDGDVWWARMLDTQLARPPGEAWKRASRSIDWGIAAYSDFKGASFVDPSHPLNAYDLTRRAPDLKVPVLVTLSDNDANYVAMGRTHGEPVANAITGALTVRLDDLGHFPFAEAPDAFAEAVAPFLRAILVRPEPENA